MPSTKVRRGLYWSTRTKTWHHEFRFLGVKQNGDTGHSNEKLAREWLKAYKERLADMEVGLVAAGPTPTLEKALAQWLGEWGPRVGERHRDITTTNIELHLAAHLKTPLPGLTTPVVNRAVADYLAQDGHSEGGANVLLRSLKVVVRHALKARRITAMPYDVPLIDVQKAPKPAMTPADVRQVLATMEALGAPSQAVDQARMMAGLGLRVSESCKARVEVVDLKRREFIPWDPVAGTKGGEAERVPIPKWLVPHLTRLVGDRREGYLIQGARNAYPSRQVVRKWIAAARKVLKWPWLTPHELRAAYATMLNEDGMSDRNIQALLRHKDPRTTQIYLRKNLSHARAAVDRIGESIEPTPAEPEQSLVSPPKNDSKK